MTPLPLAEAVIAAASLPPPRMKLLGLEPPVYCGTLYRTRLVPPPRPKILTQLTHPPSTDTLPQLALPHRLEPLRPSPLLVLQNILPHAPLKLLAKPPPSAGAGNFAHAPPPSPMLLPQLAVHPRHKYLRYSSPLV